MRTGVIVVTAVLAVAGGASVAQERDAPPPGCRWIGDDLGCKDGRGYYRRAGDGEIIGNYPLPRPKPKPAPRSQPAAPIEAPPSAGDMAGTPSAGSALAADPFAINDGSGTTAAAAPAEPPAAAAPPPADPPTPAVSSPQPKAWWQAVIDWLVRQFKDLMALLGIAI